MGIIPLTLYYCFLSGLLGTVVVYFSFQCHNFLLDSLQRDMMNLCI
uniref:Uncharacterized protein n=1 Tax=Lepeophtheirus salmonis TaxID=72036 RepID=A0A0K2TN36_LEPSM